MAFEPVDRELDLVGLEARVQQRWIDDDVFAESLRRREGAPEWVFYEGPPTANGRPGIHHVWARLVQGPLPALPHDAGPLRRPEGRMGLPRPARRARGREGARASRARPRSRTTASRRSTGAAASRCSATSRTGRRSRARIGMWIDTADAYWTLSERLHRERLVALPPDVGPGPDLRGLQGRALLRSVRDRALEPRGRAGLSRHHRAVGLRPLPGRRARLRPPRLDDHAVDADRRTSRSRSGPTSTTCGSAAPRPAA